MLNQLRAAWWSRFSRAPGGAGAGAARWRAIEEGIRAGAARPLGAHGAGIDERVVEFPWVFHRVSALAQPGSRVLDAGSVLNHAPLQHWWESAGLPPVSVVTLAPERHARVSATFRYEFADLRELPYRDGWFSVVVCISTLEHVGMDNARYGSSAALSSEPVDEATRALQELRRVTRDGGTLLLSVPVGTPSNRGWFRVIDPDDLDATVQRSGWTFRSGRYFRSAPTGWVEMDRDGVRGAGYNEQRGQRTAPAYVAAAEAVALLELQNQVAR